MTSTKLTSATIFKKILFTYLIAFVLFLPITGIILDDYKLIFHMQRPFVLALVVTVVMIVFTLIKNNKQYLANNINPVSNLKNHYHHFQIY